jgi:hypothetical protein
MMRRRPCALAVVATALALLLPQVAPGQDVREAAGDGEASAERLEGTPEEPAPDDLGIRVIQETVKAAEEDRKADREAAEAAHAAKIGKMQEKKEQTREQQEEERSEAWGNAAVQAEGSAVAVGTAAEVADPEEDED